MKKFLCTLALAGALTSALVAQPHKRVSPHETVSNSIDGDRVMLVYGRPYTKDPHTGAERKIWGTLVPFDKVWRTGADEATLMVVQRPIVLGGKTVPSGAYTLWTWPDSKGGAKLIVNRQIGQWGEGKDVYDPSQDVARVDLKKENVPNVDQFTMAVEKDSSGHEGHIVMSWETTRWSVPFTVAK